VNRESNWARLRSRKVVQWGAAYAAAAWGFLQGLEYLSETYGWSPQPRKFAVLALLIGLPIVLVLAWFHGDRGDQRVSRTELAILAVLVTLGGVLLWRYQPASEAISSIAAPSASAPLPGAAATDPRPSIAVLPFENRSANQDDAYFVDGIQDDILTQLTKVGALRVIARTSSEQLRGTTLSTREIGDRLGVVKLLQGRVQRAGDRVRINLLLIDTATESQEWAERYDRELTAANILTIQSEVAATVAAQLLASVTSLADAGHAGTKSTQSLEAWDAYHRGQEASGTSDGLPVAEQYFRKAIDADPRFALAYLELANVLIAQVYTRGARRDVNLPEAETAVETALRLDPSLPEAWIASAYFAPDEQAEAMYRKAIEIEPNSAHAHEQLSDRLWQTGRWEESLRYAEKAVALDPLSIGVNHSLAQNLEAAGRLDEAEALYHRLVEIHPSDPLPHQLLATFEAYARNRFASAVTLMEKAVELDPGHAYQLGSLVQLYLDLEDDARAKDRLDDALRRWPDRTNLNILAANSALYQGDEETAIRYVEKTLETSPTHGPAIYHLSRVDFERKDFAAARARYAFHYPELLAPEPPDIGPWDMGTAITLAAILLRTNETERARVLLDRAERAIGKRPRLGEHGYGIHDVRIHALRGDKARALAALRAAVKEGWRGPFWRMQLLYGFSLDSLRSEPEFKAADDVTFFSHFSRRWPRSG
jgi:TolB-like protein/Tfp pilus assembly protein PilF